MEQALYPLKFQPILKETLWGGEKLKNILNKPSVYHNIGESWEISNVPNNISIVANGPLKGESLQSLLNSYARLLIGDKNYKRFGADFPLLIKFIDAKKDLSIQLHPDDAIAQKRHNTFGKTEMWYVMQADNDANLIVGFNQHMDKEIYLKHLEAKTLTKILNFDKVKEGDAYFIEAGRVHAIGAGVLLTEIQQTSDITYRVYDWDRLDQNGEKRLLHVEEALDAIKFNLDNDFKIEYEKDNDISNSMLSTPYFTTNYLDIKKELKKENTLDSFLVYICLNGEVDVITPNRVVTVVRGETILIPACLETFKLKSKNAKMLEVYVQS